MYQRKGILLFGLIEIAIGATTLAGVIRSLFLQISQKPLNILIFVIVSSIISVSLGIGIFLRLKSARKLLIFFAGWIILSKILIFTDIIALNGALVTTLPPDLKNSISVLYHALLISHFSLPNIKAEFKQ